MAQRACSSACSPCGPIIVSEEPGGCVSTRDGVCVVAAVRTLCMRAAETQTLMAQIHVELKANNTN